MNNYVPPGQRTSLVTCAKKRSYRTYTESYRVYKDMLADSCVVQKPLLNAYRCRACDRYHIGRKAHL